MTQGYASARRTVEASRSVNVLWYQRQHLFDVPDRILRTRVSIAVPNTGQTQWLEVCWTRCRFGGERPWFKCLCGKNVLELFSPWGGPYRCRHCCGLAYASSQAGKHDRTITAARRPRERLGDRSGNLTLPLPTRPKGMHRRTYERLLWQAKRCEQRVFGSYRARYAKLLGALS
jgi:hypothetical protein